MPPTCLRTSNPIAASTAPRTALRTATFSRGNWDSTQRNTSTLAASASTMVASRSRNRAQAASSNPTRPSRNSPTPAPTAVRPNETASATPSPTSETRSFSLPDRNGCFFLCWPHCAVSASRRLVIQPSPE